jgi:hypothetical protein
MTTRNIPQLDQRKWERVREGTPESRNGIRDGSLRGIYYDRYSRRYCARYADLSGNWRWQQFSTLKEAQRAKFKLEEVKENGDLQKLDLPLDSGTQFRRHHGRAEAAIRR